MGKKQWKLTLFYCSWTAYHLLDLILNTCYLLTKSVFRTVRYWDQGPEVQTELTRSVLKDRGLNILQYKKKTRLITSLSDGQGIREGQPSLKGLCVLGFKAGKLLGHSSTRQRRQVPSSQGHLAANSTVLLTGTLSNLVPAFLIPFHPYDILCMILH